MFCYVHVPFCSSKCRYCRFASFWGLNDLKIDTYIDYLVKEIEYKKINSLIGFKKLKSIYFWGWTPSILKIENLEKILKILKNNYWFDKDIEISLEATPITINKENLLWWKKIWINRISVWVQTLNNDSLVEIGREEKWNIFFALDCIQEVGFKNISLDFIIWLPHVKNWEIKSNIEFVLKNYDFVKHISVYMLEEYYYPWNWNNISIWDKDYLQEYNEINNLLNKKSFNKYEISNYSIDWYECKHNKAYWNHSNILAFWLWAHWLLNNQRYYNSENFLEYYSWKQIFEEKLSKKDIFLENLMFWLRTSWISKDIIKELNQDKIDYFIKNWYLKSGFKLSLTNKGILLMDYITSELLE